MYKMKNRSSSLYTIIWQLICLVGLVVFLFLFITYLDREWWQPSLKDPEPPYSNLIN